MKELNEAREKAMGILNGTEDWIEWIHEGSAPAVTQELKDSYGKTPDVKHCAQCKNLNGCRFLSRKMPELPLHPNCHCETEKADTPIPGITAFAECPIEKIKNWAFVDLAKKGFFESNGYGIMDAEEMQMRYEKQAAVKYADGDYDLGVLNNFGQRITIRIELPRRVGDNTKPLNFKTGWMVFPYGKIVLTTPATNLSSK
ncbi:hypothetical protein FACS1894211_10200 [Clostridia bacterium]|nr:hypothetical protein FACS1894211_10200 [Clostridia bacterium]